MRPTLIAFLAVALVGPGLAARADCPPGPIHVGAAPLRLGMSRAEVARALAAGGDPLVTRLDEARLVATDAKARRALAVLTFDGGGRLARIQRNRSPEAATGIDLAEALHRVLSEEACGAPAACSATATHRLLTGPHTGVRDPGKPDLEQRTVAFSCGNRTVELYLDAPTQPSRILDSFLLVHRVILYESFGAEPAPAPPGGAAAKAARSAAGEAAPAR